MSTYHTPVLLRESVEGLNLNPQGIYIDATYGGGGHSYEILKRLDSGRLYAFDQDEDAIGNLPADKRLIFIQGNFRFLKNYMKYEGIEQIDGLLADLGVSSHHFNAPERGFTYRSEAGLDMRMNRHGRLTAETVVNDYEMNRLTGIFREYGELREARRLAVSIDKTRASRRIVSTTQLIDSIESLAPRQSENQFYSKVFQAIRIEVNHELENLKEMLQDAYALLKPGGRLVIISYHSLEDRMVKNFMRWGNTLEQPVKDVFGQSPEPFTLITRKPLTASDKEVLDNPRARSARLRIAEKKQEP
jgi:16S rRNA (cytosine1402-N4)-methyltransferase